MTAAQIAAPLPSCDVEQPATGGTHGNANPGGTFDGAGIYDMAEPEYLADPVPGGSLSASGCKQLLKSPARFHHNLQPGNRPASKEVWDFGTAAHATVLGAGAEIIYVDFDSWRSNAAKEAKAEAEAAGKVARLLKDRAKTIAMADAIHEHPVAGVLLDPERGKPEQSAFWEADGISKRARFDWLRDVVEGERFIIPDYKTCPEDGAEQEAFAKSVINFDYCIQAAWYIEAATVLLGVDDPAFLFIVQETEAPYFVNVIELSPELLLRGAQRAERAIRLFRECRERDVWPAYGDDIKRANSPTWASFAHQGDLELWGMAS